MCLEETILVIWGEIFMAFNKQCFLGFSKRQFTCPRKQIDSFVWEKLWFFHLLSTLTKIILVYGKKHSPRGVKNAFGVSRWRLWGFFWEKPWIFVIFAPWAENFRTFAKHLGQGSQNINLSVQGSFSRKTFKKLMTFFSKFCNLREKVSDFGRKNSRQGIKNHILRVHENILTKQFSWKIDSFSVNFRNLNGNKSYFERKFSGVFAKTIRAWFSKPQFTCPGKHFAKSFFL